MVHEVQEVILEQVQVEVHLDIHLVVLTDPTIHLTEVIMEVMEMLQPWQ